MKAIFLPVMVIAGLSLQAQNWSTVDFKIKCQYISETANGDYYSSEGLMDDPCEYIVREDDSKYLISEEERNRVKMDLVSAAALLSGDQFKEPKLKGTDQYWEAKIFPGDCWCSVLSCCDNYSDPNILGSYTRNATGGVVADKGELFVKSTGPEENIERSVTVAHELFHGVIASYANTPSTQECFPFCWIGEGGSEAFGYFWAKQVGKSAYSGFNRKYDIPLNSDDYALGQQTGHFWEFLAKRRGSFDFMKHILSQDWSNQTVHNVGEGVFQVNEGLKAAGYENGLLSAYKQFVKTLVDESFYNTVHRKTVDKEDEDFYIEVSELKPISVSAGKVKVETGNLDVVTNQGKRIDLVIEIEGEEGNENLHLFVDGQEITGKYSEDVTEKCRNNPSLEVFVQLANINPIAEMSIDQSNIKIKIRLETKECPLMPQGYKKLVYKSETNGKEQLTIVYNLSWEEIEHEGEKIDSMSMWIYSHELEKTLGTADLGIECQEGGIVMKGMETATIVPPNMSNTASLNMSVSTNTNLIPHRPEVGSTLPNARVVVNSETVSDNEFVGSIYMDINSNITNRRVVSRESVSVPAGTFDCWKIEYSTTANISLDGTRRTILKLLERQLQGAGNSTCTLWITENHGWVKQVVRSSAGTSTYELVQRVPN